MLLENHKMAAKDAIRERKFKLGKLLIKYKYITEEQLKEALKKSFQTGGRLGSNLIKLGYIDENVLLKFLSAQLKLKGVNLQEIVITVDTQKLLSFETVKTLNIIPIGQKEGRLILGMADPYDFNVVQELEFSLGTSISPVVVPELQIERVIEIWGREGYAKYNFDGSCLKVHVSHSEESADIFSLLRTLRDKKAADLHLSVGVPPSLKIDNDLVRLNLKPLTESEMLAYMNILLNDTRKETFAKKQTLDFSYMLPDGGRFRMNIYKQRGTVSITARYLVEEIPSLEKLELPAFLQDFSMQPQGLILLTGPTGHGKSTTLACLINIINIQRKLNIITIEDPIEYLHSHINSNVNQREVGIDTPSFVEGMKYIFRQDPDVIMIGELRDLESISIGMTAAETGHLVFGTLHTNDTVGAVDRIIDVFPGDKQNQVRGQLADVLLLVFAQRLVPRANGGGRVPAWEKLENTYNVGNLIRTGKTHLIRSTTASSHGFIPMEASLAGLVKSDKVAVEEAFRFVDNQQLFKDLVSGPGDPTLIMKATSG